MSKAVVFAKLCELFSQPTPVEFPIVDRDCFSGSPCDYALTGETTSTYTIRANEFSKTHDLSDSDNCGRPVYRLTSWTWRVVVEFACEVDTSDFENQILNLLPQLDIGGERFYIVPGTHRYSPPRTDSGMTVTFELIIIPEL